MGRIARFDEDGVSLIEVLVAVLIVGVGAVGVALMFSSGRAYVEAEGDNRVALYLAQQKIEQLRSVGYVQLESPWIETQTIGWITPTGSAATDQKYTRTWSIVCVDRDNYVLPVTCTTGAAKLISVTVQRPADQRAGAITLTSVLADHP